MPHGPLFPPGVREGFMDILLIFLLIVGILWIVRSFSKSGENISTKDPASSLENTIKEMTEEIRGLRRDIKELKEELKE